MSLFIKEDENEKTYYVVIMETLKKKVEVNATSEEDAIAKVEEAYNKCDIILDENDFTDVKFKIKKVVEDNEE
jgi:molybdopterin/thiamine biosynthesis adenylyltransferase